MTPGRRGSSIIDAAQLPRSWAAFAGRRGLSALLNARSAAESIRTAVAERTELTRRLSDADAAPDDADLTLLTEPESRSLLAAHTVGRLAYVARAGVPDIVPVNYVLDGTDVLIRSGPGPKLQAAERGDRVAFEVDGLDEDTHSGWSVVVHGTASVLTRTAAEQLPATPAPWADGPRQHVIRVRTSRITGRRLGARGSGT